LPATTGSSRREPLSRDAVLRAALAIADTDGLSAMSMRKLGAALGVEAMSLYNHVKNKGDVTTGIVDIVWAEAEIDTRGEPWRPALRRIAISVHEALLRHPWACGLQTPGIPAARLRYIDTCLAHLTDGDFSPEVIYHAHHVIDGHIFGFTQQMIDFTLAPQVEDGSIFDMVRAAAGGEVPHLIAHIEAHAHEAQHGTETGFEFGLDLILEGLEQAKA
jgi:AcrR family transcriptional regulator